MSTVEVTDDSAAGEVLNRAASGRRRARIKASRPAVALLAVYLAAVGVYVALALRSPLPLLFPDEGRYLHLARGLADGDGFWWRGVHPGQSAALYVYFLTPVWMLIRSAPDAYAVSKILGTFALCTQVIPVWLLGRELLGRRLALVAAALAVGGTWMLSSAETATEALAFPLTTAAICLATLAVMRPTRRRSLLALAFVLLATWARIQLAALLPALVVIFALDVLRVPDERRARLRAHGPALVTAATLTLAGVAIALLKPSLTGDYAGFFSWRPGIATIAGKTALQLAELTAAAGFVPVLLAASAALTRRAWRDPRTGPLLLVFWVVAGATTLQSGLYLAGYPSAPWGVQRYVTYAAPLAVLLTLVLASDRRMLTPRVLAVATGAGLLLLLRPHIRMMGIERATWATEHRLHQALGLDGRVGLALVAVVAMVAVALVRRRLDGARAVLATAAVLFLVLVGQDQAAWHQLTTTSRAVRSSLPRDLSWVDHHARGPVADLIVTQGAPHFADLDTFNRDINQIYAPAGDFPGPRPEGRICPFHIGPTGLLQFGAGCGPTPHRFLINDPQARLTFYDEVASASDPHVGRIAEVAPTAMPRARSIIVLACPRHTPTFFKTTPKIIPASAPAPCGPATSGLVYLDAAAELVAEYRGGTRPGIVTVGSRREAVPPHANKAFRLSVPLGAFRFTLQQSWRTTAGSPRLRSLTLHEAGGQTVSLI